MFISRYFGYFDYFSKKKYSSICPMGKYFFSSRTILTDTHECLQALMNAHKHSATDELMKPSKLTKSVITERNRGISGIKNVLTNY